MLKQRVLTAIILIPFVFVGIFYTSPLLFRLILAGVLLLAGWEWSNLIPLKETNWRVGYLLLTAIVFYFSSFISQNILIVSGAIGWLCVSYYIAINFLLFTGHSKVGKSDSEPISARNKPIFTAITGIFVLTVCWVSLSFLHDQNPKWVIMLLLIVWIADTAAYFSGRRFGKHALAPQISPKKTWEGVLGALLAVFVMVLLGGLLMKLKISLLIYLALLSLITVLISIVGDLFESLIKRQANVKDSGKLLPGHGGLLDRIDSLIAAAPVFAGGILLLKIF